MIFQELHTIALKTLNPRKLSRTTWSGAIAAALETDKDNVYTGVSVDTPDAFGWSAEQAALAAMLTAGETRIIKIVVVSEDNKILPLSPRCREFIAQIDEKNHNALVLLEDNKITTIEEILSFPLE